MQFFRMLRLTALSALGLALASCSAEAPPLESTPGPPPIGLRPATVIAGADVLTMTDAGMLTERTVVISGDHIAEIRPFRAADLAIPGALDARGKVVMPGLVDMHVHFAPAPGEPGDPAQRAAATMLAHGVTTARSMAGNAEHLKLRENIESGTIAGPRIYLGSPAISDNNTPTAEDGIAKVREAKSAGFDFIKSHFISDVAVWQAVRDTAEALDLGTAGHVSNTVGIERAISEGQQIEHLDGYAAALLPEESPMRTVEWGQVPPPPVMAEIDRDGITSNPVFDLAASRRSFQVPTLSLFEKLFDTSLTSDQLKALPEMRFVPDEAIAQWEQQRTAMAAQLPADYAADVIALRREILRALDARDVPIMAGSDTAQAFHVWGPALHEEIEALARVIGNESALRAATVTPRDYFRSLPLQGSAKGWQADFGTVARSMRADLLVLAGDPRDSLAVLRRPEAVIARGQLYSRTYLDSLLDDVSAAAKGTSASKVATTMPPVWILRHLETDESAERHLTASSQEQAGLLANRLASEGIGAIWVTDTARARETGGPLAERLGLTPRVYDPADPAGLLEKIAQEGVPVLIVGHSNTAPDLARRLGASEEQAAKLAEFGVLMESGRQGVMLAPLSARGPSPTGSCDQKGLPADAKCLTIEMAEDRSNADGRKIPIKVAVLPATVMATKDPLVVIPGGPGLGAVQSGAGIAMLFAEWRSDRDLVLIDQRGTGGSNRLACMDGVNGEGLLAALSPMPDELVKNCRDRLSETANLAHYTTREFVQDIERVRATLGYDRLDLFGMSYGTRPALDYLRLYPDHTGEVVIRAAAPVGMQLPLWTPRDAQAAFDRLEATCQAQPDCAARHPALATDLAKAFDRLDDGPAEVSVIDPRNGAKVDAKIESADFASIMFFMLYIPQFTEHLPPLLEKAAAGNFSPIVQAVSPALVGIVGEVAWGLRWSVICDEDVRPIDAASIDANVGTAFMGRAAIDQDREACSLWPKAEIPDDYFTPVESEKPVLIISGAHDPVAGEVWGNWLANRLDNTRHIVVADAAHLPALPGCMAREAKLFLDSGNLNSVDADCEENKTPLRLRVAS